MGREISLFSNYHSDENMITNYCGLILKLLYEENPNSFEEVLISLVDDDLNIIVGPNFIQQKKVEKSIPDLAITQNYFSVFFETKIEDWFYSDQIERHIKSLKKTTGTKVVFLLSNFESTQYENRFKEEMKIAKERGIILQPITFEDFVEVLENVKSSNSFNNMLEEFKGYLDRNGHLPKWKYLLDVISCSRSINEIDEYVYICPDTGGAYSHRRAKYFGPYSNKRVLRIFEIDAVISIDEMFSNYSLKWNNTKEEKEKLYKRAKEKVELFEYRVKENKTTPLQVFLLSKPQKTNFYKSSSGGMIQSKKYFWDIAKGCNNSEELAKKLENTAWEIFI